MITGGLGFIGSNLAHAAVAAGARVTIYDCLDPKSGGNMQNVESIQNKIKIILKDLRSFEGISDAVVDQDMIFHCAAYTSHPESMKDPLTDIDVNCKGTIHVLEAARRFCPGVKIVHIGTSTQIGKLHSATADEGHPEFPTDIYSANKTASEKYVLIYGGAYGMNVCVLRLVNIFGPRSNIKSSDFGFINYFIGLALQGRELPVFGTGEQKRNVVYVDDAVSALLGAAVNPRSRGEVLFVASNKQYTAKEIAESITQIIGGTVCFVSWPKHRQAIEIGDAIISNKKIKRLLGWSAETSFREGLIRTREYYQSNLEAYL